MSELTPPSFSPEALFFCQPVTFSSMGAPLRGAVGRRASFMETSLLAALETALWREERVDVASLDLLAMRASRALMVVEVEGCWSRVRVRGRELRATMLQVGVEVVFV